MSATPTSPDDARAVDPEPREACDHICLKDADHVERGEPHFYGYEHPSPRHPERAGWHHNDNSWEALVIEHNARVAAEEARDRLIEVLDSIKRDMEVLAALDRETPK